MTDGNDLLHGTKTVRVKGLDDFGGYAFFEKEIPAGLTKREHFAAMAMQGMCVGRKLSESPEMAITNKAVKMADALIKALNAEAK